MPWIEAHEINHGKNLVNDEIIENDGSEPEKPINPTPESNQVEEEIYALNYKMHYTFLKSCMKKAWLNLLMRMRLEFH